MLDRRGLRGELLVFALGIVVSVLYFSLALGQKNGSSDLKRSAEQWKPNYWLMGDWQDVTFHLEVN